MPRPVWADTRQKPTSSQAVAISSYAHRISLYPEWPKFFEEICRRANHPSIDLAEPNPYRAVALAARQALVNEIARMIEDGKGKPAPIEVNENG